MGIGCGLELGLGLGIEPGQPLQPPALDLPFAVAITAARSCRKARWRSQTSVPAHLVS